MRDTVLSERTHTADYCQNQAEIALVNSDGVPKVDSRVLAEKCEIQHRNIRVLIETHLPTIEESFGRVAFETHTLQTGGGVQQVKFALLTEDQATFLCTLCRNTVPVVKFKVALVKAFSKARYALAEDLGALPAALVAPPEIDTTVYLFKKLQNLGVAADTALQSAIELIKEQGLNRRNESRAKQQEPIGRGDWKSQPVTKAQRYAIESYGYEVPETRGEAWALIKKLKAEPAKPKGRPPIRITGEELAALCGERMPKWKLREAIQDATNCGQTAAYSIIEQGVSVGWLVEGKLGKSSVYSPA